MKEWRANDEKRNLKSVCYLCWVEWSESRLDEYVDFIVSALRSQDEEDLEQKSMRATKQPSCQSIFSNCTKLAGCAGWSTKEGAVA